MSSLKTRHTGHAYWRSLNELADTPEFQAAAEKEFADYSPEEMTANPARRSFMKLMSASLALAGATSMTGCRRWPEKTLAPFAEPPTDVEHIPGIPLPYATAYEINGVGRGLVVSTYDGRPIKIEGNPGHPTSLGAADSWAQASVLEMWDPERSRHVAAGGQDKAWADVAPIFEAARADGGRGLAILSESSGSPSFAEARARLLKALPNVAWYEYEPLNRDNELAGAVLAFGRPVRTQLKFDAAEVVVVLDADPLGHHAAEVRYARDWAERRRDVSGKMNRMYAAEPVFTVTGSNADRRLPTRRQDIPALVAQIEAGIVGGHMESDFLAAVVKDLRAAKGRGLVVVGEAQPPEVHAAVHRINAQLGNVGKTVVYTEEPLAGKDSHAAQIKALADALNGGGVKTLLILGGNPAYNAPADLKFGDAIKKADTSLHLGQYADETSAACTWHLPRAHYLESWGDVAAWDGTLSVQQPLIMPLFDGKSAIEVLAMVYGDDAKEGYEFVRRTWQGKLAAGDFEKHWRRVLHDGYVADTAYKPLSVSARAGTLKAAPAAEGLELVLMPSSNLHDGRFASNGWLQELPDPVTRLTWDNCAIMDPNTADKLGVSHGNVVKIDTEAGSLEIAVFIVPGGAPGSVGVALGYGRAAAQYIGTDVGFNAYPLRTAAAQHGAAGIKISATGRDYVLATIQDQWAIDTLGKQEREKRSHWLVREISLEEVPEAAHVIDEAVPEALHPPSQPTGDPTVPLQVFDEPLKYELGNKWGMAIDLNACTGCNACVIACQAENNIPIVGKAQVKRGRIMHWIRVDRYFRGDPANPESVGSVQQPVTCHHCENAPCESVCPVAATQHDSEGLNIQIYNRCIGSRYCSNNCPYKVRRFNWFDWNYKKPRSDDSGGFYLGWPDQQQGKTDPIRALGNNPEVTVRMRGVMEKCMFCVQRIKAVSIRAKNESRPIKDGEITPACAQTCPTQAIVFGDLNDPESRVTKQHKDQRAYEMLRELNVRPRNRYLARVTNTGAESAAPHAEKEHG